MKKLVLVLISVGFCSCGYSIRIEPNKDNSKVLEANLEQVIRVVNNHGAKLEKILAEKAPEK